MKTVCPDENILARWLEGEVDATSKPEITEHLASCDDCRRAVALAWLTVSESAPGLSSESEQSARAVVSGGSGCPEETRLAHWLDGSLEVGERTLLVQHLGACDRCRRAVALAWISTHETTPEADSSIRRAARAVVRERTACPDDDRLAAFLEGHLVREARTDVIEHLASCDDCRRAAALSRLAKSEPIHALTVDQERAARSAVMRRLLGIRRYVPVFAGVAAAAALIISFVYFSTRPAPHADPAVAGKDEGSKALRIPNLEPIPAAPKSEEKAAPQPVVPTPTEEPPKVVPPPEPKKELPPPIDPPPPTSSETPAPKEPPGRTRAELAGHFKPIDVFEFTGAITTDVADASRLAYNNILKTDEGTTLNLGGQALVSLDRQSEAAVAKSSNGSSLVLWLHQGTAYIDTARETRSWEVWHGESRIELPSACGRLMVNADKDSLGVVVMSGQAKVRRGNAVENVAAGTLLTLRNGSIANSKADSAALASGLRRAAELRPKSMVLWRAGFGEKGGAYKVNTGTLASEGRVEFVSAVESGVPFKCAEVAHAHKWAIVELPEPMLWTTQTYLHARYRSTAPGVHVAVDGYLRSHTLQFAKEWVETDWALGGAALEGELIMPQQTVFRFVYIGVRADFRLELDSLEIRRTID